MNLTRCAASVYLIDGGGGLYKIGCANYPRGRLLQLQAASPVDLKLLAEVRSADADGLEKRLHEKFKKYRVRGEWFRLRPEDVERFADIAEREDRLREVEAHAQVEAEAARQQRGDREAVLRAVAGILNRLGQGDIPGTSEATLDAHGAGVVTGSFAFRGRVSYTTKLAYGVKSLSVEVVTLEHSR